MAMGIVSDSEFELELSRLSRNKPEVQLIKHGRGNVTEVPESVKKVIAEEAIAGTPAKVLAGQFNVSPSSISAYKVGATSTASYDKPDKDLFKHVNRIKERITSKAQKRIIAALNALTPEVMSDAKPRDLAGIAKDMSTVVKNLTPDTQVINDNRKVLIYQPRIREEDSFDVITVNE